MTRDEQKRAVAAAAMAYVTAGHDRRRRDGVDGAFFIEELAARPELVAAAVPSSEASAAALRAAGVRVVGLDEVPSLPLYVDGADAVDPRLRLIKGAGGALAREKVVASAAELFVCIVDESKLVERLGDPRRPRPPGRLGRRARPARRAADGGGVRGRARARARRQLRRPPRLPQRRRHGDPRRHAAWT